MSSKVSAVCSCSPAPDDSRRLQRARRSSTDLISFMQASWTTKADAMSASRGGAVALLVLLSAPARTRIVAADLGRVVPDRLHGGIVAADARRRPRLPRRPERRRCRGRAERRRRLLAAAQNQRRPRAPCGPRRRRFLAPAQDRPQQPQVADDLLIDAILHRLKELEAFPLVLDERIALAVPPQADAFLQVVEAVEVVLPLLVDDLQHDVALDPLQDLAADQLFLLLV